MAGPQGEAARVGPPGVRISGHEVRPQSVQGVSSCLGGPTCCSTHPKAVCRHWPQPQASWFPWALSLPFSQGVTALPWPGLKPLCK